MQASADYEAMAEGFARAMAEIGVELINAKDLQALYNTDEMLRAVVALYTHVMRFLLFSMKWCKKYGSGSIQRDDQTFHLRRCRLIGQ
jgi:hypothetical protein